MVGEGFAIAAPLVGWRPHLVTFIGLAALAGLPAVPGVWIGAQANQPVLDRDLLRHRRRRDPPDDHRVIGLIARREGRAALATPASLGGVAAGLAVMYLTALFV